MLVRWVLARIGNTVIQGFDVSDLRKRIPVIAYRQILHWPRKSMATLQIVQAVAPEDLLSPPVLGVAPFNRLSSFETDSLSCNGDDGSLHPHPTSFGFRK